MHFKLIVQETSVPELINLIWTDRQNRKVSFSISDLTLFEADRKLTPAPANVILLVEAK